MTFQNKSGKCEQEGRRGLERLQSPAEPIRVPRGVFPVGTGPLGKDTQGTSQGQAPGETD